MKHSFTISSRLANLILTLVLLLPGCNNPAPEQTEKVSVDNRPIIEQPKTNETANQPLKEEVKSEKEETPTPISSNQTQPSTETKKEKNPYYEGSPQWYEWNSEHPDIDWNSLNLSKDVSKWQTYVYDELGFEIKYPQGWEVEKLKDDYEYTISSDVKDYLFIKFQDKNDPYEDDSFETNNIANIKIFDAERLSLEDWLKKHNNAYSDETMSSKLSEELIEINDLKGVKILEGGPNSTTWLAYYFKNDKKNFVYRYKYLADGDVGFGTWRKIFIAYKEIWELMLSTLTLR